MTIGHDTLREIELLLREALAKLEPDGAFRQRVLVQMALCEVERNRNPPPKTPAGRREPKGEPKGRPA